MSSVQHPRVSVIIPTYNNEAFIEQAILSVFAQTYDDYEIIVGDDGSTDHTQKLLKQFGEKITVLTLPHRGICATRNEAIRKSHGELIALLDSDDIWEPDKLKLQVDYIDKHTKFAVIYSYSTNFTDASDTNRSLPKRIDFEGYIFKDLFTKTGFANSTIILRRSVFDEVGGYDEALTAMEDYELSLRISLKYQIGRVPEILVRRRIHHGSFYSSGYDNQYTYQLPVYDKFMSDPKVEELIGKTKQAFMTGFILKFIYKNLFDNHQGFIAQKLNDLKRYSPDKATVAQRLVMDNNTDPSIWRPLIDEFEIWHEDIKHKAALYKKSRT